MKHERTLHADETRTRSRLVSSLSYIGARIVVQYTAAAAHRIGRARHMKKEREAVSLSVRPQHLTPETRSLRLAVPQIVLLLPLSLFSLFSLHLDTKRDKKKRKRVAALSLSLSLSLFSLMMPCSPYRTTTSLPLLWPVVVVVKRCGGV